MNNVLKNSDLLVTSILNNSIYSKIIIIISIINIIYSITYEPSNIVILLFYNKYFIVLYLLLIFYITLYNPIISFLLAIHFIILMNKLLSFKLIVKSNYGGKKNEFYIKRDALSYYLN